YFEIARKLPEYAAEPRLPLFLWLRHMTGLKLVEVHRRHLGTQARDAEREISLHRGGLPEADSISLAAQLLGQLTTPSQAAIRAELRLLVQEALNTMDPIDREVLALKHFEQLSTTEIAEVLGLSKAGAGSRYLRAIKRLREILSQVPGFEELKRGRETVWPNPEVAFEPAEDFLEPSGQGERPPLQEYIDRRPDLAGEIRDVFPAMAIMEKIAIADASLDRS